MSLKWDRQALAHHVRSLSWGPSEQRCPVFCWRHSGRAGNTGPRLCALFPMALRDPGLVFSPSPSLSFPTVCPSLPGRPFPRVSPWLLLALQWPLRSRLLPEAFRDHTLRSSLFLFFCIFIRDTAVAMADGLSLLEGQFCQGRDFCLSCSLSCSRRLDQRVVYSDCSINTCFA